MEGDLEMCEDKMLVATQKLDKVINKNLSIICIFEIRIYHHIIIVRIVIVCNLLLARQSQLQTTAIESEKCLRAKHKR